MEKGIFRQLQCIQRHSRETKKYREKGMQHFSEKFVKNLYPDRLNFVYLYDAYTLYILGIRGWEMVMPSRMKIAMKNWQEFSDCG